MRRREFLALVSAGLTPAVPRVVQAQGARTHTPSRIGVLFATVPDVARPYEAALLKGMRERGYVPERDLELLIRHADGHLDRLPALARELVAFKPALIVTASNITSIAVAEADP